MSTHTPGPWRAAPHPDKPAHWQIIGRQGPLNVCPAIAHSQADARLITAAPDMHKAGKDLLDDVRRRYPGEELRCPYMRALAAAIAKAEGKES